MEWEIIIIHFFNISTMLSQALLIFASVYHPSKTVKCLALQNVVKTNRYASNSVLLSLAAHITFVFPHLNIVGPEHKMPEFKAQEKQVNEYLTYHPLLQFWCDKFSDSILNNNAIRKQNILYILLQLTNKQLDQLSEQRQKLEEFQISYQQNWIDKILKDVSGLQTITRKNVQLAYLNVSGNQLREDMYMPIVNVRAIVLGQVYNNQKWRNYDVLKGQIPSLKDFLELNGVIIPGSTNSVLSDTPQVQEMSKNLFDAFGSSNKLKIVGICYGHQLIALKNKGFVVKKQRTDKVQKYEFYLKQIINLQKSFPFLQNLADKTHETLLLEHHQDYVQQVSDDFYILAKSQTSQVEITLHKSGRMLSFQSHPQYLYEYIQGYLKRLARGKSDPYFQSLIKKGEQNIMRINQDSSVRMRLVISQFLNWNCQSHQNITS